MIKGFFIWLKRYMMTTCLEESEYGALSDRIESENRKNLKTFSAVSLVFLSVMIVVGSFNKLAHGNLAVYIVTAIVMVAINFFSQTKRGITIQLVYLFSIALMAFGIIIGTVTNPSVAAGTYVALLLTVPMLFVDRPFRVMLLILCSDAVFILLVLLKKDPVTWSNDLINACIFGPISIIISSYMMRVKLRSYRNEKIISQIAKTDVMTGLRNRNCFEGNLKKYAASKERNGFCIYVDVNGLHELNNVKGHAAGDAMLVFIARELKKIFSQEDVYRMGGDEFLVCGVNKGEQNISVCLERFKIAVNEAGYHVAIGVEHRQSGIFEIEAMVKESERKMLQDKSLFYKMAERDRRGR